jgi:glutaredoxin 3
MEVGARMILYTLTDCPNCDNVKRMLHAAGYEFEEKDMSSPESITEMRFNGCFEMNAPVLQIEDKFYNYDQLKDGKISEAI